MKAFIERAKAVGAAMQKRFGVPLSPIEIDTVVATAGYKKSGDEQDSVLGAQLMEALKEISAATGAFVLGVDHFGKTAETGTRGTSAKEDDADVVLVTLGEKSISGIATNPRLAVRKVRGGIAGRGYAFTTEVVPTDTVDRKGRQVTTLKVICSSESSPADDRKKDPWSNGLRLLRKIMMSMLVDWGRR